MRMCTRLRKDRVTYTLQQLDTGAEYTLNAELLTQVLHTVTMAQCRWLR